MIKTPLKYRAELAAESYNKAPIVAGPHSCRVDRCNGEITISVTGTQKDFRDILTDLHGWPRSIYGTFGHSGFLGAAKALWPKVEHYFWEGDPVILNGHSLGGSTAVWLAMIAIKSGNAKNLVGISAFGCPRPGGIGVRETLEAFHGNLQIDLPVFGNDIVATIPGRWRIPFWKTMWHPAGDIMPIGKPIGKFESHRVANYIYDYPV